MSACCSTHRPGSTAHSPAHRCHRARPLRPCSRPRRPWAAHAQAVAPSGSSSSLEGAHAISVRDVRLAYRRQGGAARPVLDGVSLNVPRGTFHMLLGANGCGKSTLLRVLAGLFRADSGSVRMDAPCGMVFQNPDHQVVLPSVAADVAFGLGRYSLSPEAVQAAVAHSLGRVGLGGYGQRPTSSLSGGQKQRVAIAGALAESPRVLLLDELTTFLDYEDQENVLQCVRDIVHSSRHSSSSSSGNNSSSSSSSSRSDGDATGPPVSSAHSSNGSSSSSNASGSSSGDADNSGQPAAAAAAAAAGAAAAAAAAGAEAGVTALWVTHRLEELQWADSVSYMDGGRVLLTGTPEEARRHMRQLGATF